MNGLSWSAPGANPGLDPAARMSQFRFGGGGSPHLGNAGQNQLGSATQSALSDVAKIMQQWKNDKIANALLDQHADDPLVQKVRATGASGSQAFQIYQTLQGQDQEGEMYRLKHLKAQQDVGEAVNPSGDDMVSTPYGKMTPYQAASIQTRGGGEGAVNSWKNAVPVARGKLDEQGNFTNQYTGAEQGDYVKLRMPTGKEVIIPWESYQGKTGAQKQANVPQNVPRGTSDITGSNQATSTPNVGDRRTIGGQLAQWDGKGWVALNQ